MTAGFLLENYDAFYCKPLNINNLNHGLLVEKLEKFPVFFQGRSFSGRKLFAFKIGNGQKKVLMWSQMHGNEPVSTLGLLDVMFFLTNPEFKELSAGISENLTILAVPMLNPDGAELNIRRNAQGIDLNRDALKLVSPEAKFLFDIVENFNPDFAFNLHDQDIYYGTGNSSHPTALALLAPSANPQKKIIASQQKAINIISLVFRELSDRITIARYNDDFMPTAFGDNLQARNIATLLFEAGYFVNDDLRITSRKFYAIALILALKFIAEGKICKDASTVYSQIPFNIREKFADVIYRNLTIRKLGQEFTTDLALWRGTWDKEDFNFMNNPLIIKDLGDLRTIKGFREFDCSKIKIQDKNNRIRRGKKANFLLYLNHKCTQIK